MSQHRRTHSLRDVNPAYFDRRFGYLRKIIIAVVVAIVAQLIHLQLLNHASSVQQSRNQILKPVSIPSLRGGIYDRYGQILSISAPADQVIADNFRVKDPAKEARALASHLHMSVATLERKLSLHSGCVILTNSLPIKDGTFITEHNFDGINVYPASFRESPNGQVGTALIGKINAAGIGSAGLEYQYNSLLAGQDGLERVYRSPKGVSLPVAPTQVLKKAVRGQGLELTVDTALQYVTEQALGKQMHDMEALTGVAIVMDVKTGEVLADVSLVNTKTSAGPLGPISTYGVDIGVPGIQQTVNNMALQWDYEPGSAFKLVPFSAALNAKTITPQTMFTIPNSLKVNGTVLHDAEGHPLEHFTATQVLAQSSNIGTYKIAQTVGKQGVLSEVLRLGFGQLTGLNYPGESAGILKTSNNFAERDLANLSIGQVDAVPPIQVLDAYNAVANGGVFVAPKLVRAMINANGQAVATPPSPAHRIMPANVAGTLRTMLQQVVMAGTGIRAVIPGYLVAGKTGTAEVPNPHALGYIYGQYNATFAGFAPANHPVLSMLVVLQRPLRSYYGGTAACPVFQRVMSYALHHYGIVPDGVSNKPVPGISSDVKSDVT